MGADKSLVHTYVDSPLVNGRRYYYAVTAYDRGSVADNIHPSETRKYIAVDASGKIQEKGSNVVLAEPTAPALGYIPPRFDIEPRHIGAAKVGGGTVRVRVIDPNMIIDGATYEIDFLDVATDGVDNDLDWNSDTDDVGTDGIAGTMDADSTEGNEKPDLGEPNVDYNDPDEWIPLETTGFILKNATDKANPIALDTIMFQEYLLMDTSLVMIRNLYDDNNKQSATLTAISNGFEFFVYNPPTSYGLLNSVDEDGEGIVQGLKWSANIDPNQTYLLDFGVWDNTAYFPGHFYPRQYKIVFFDELADTSDQVNLALLNFPIDFKIPPVPTNFKIYDTVTGEELPYGFRENIGTSPVPKGHFSAKDEIWLFEKLPNDSTIITYYILNNSGDDNNAFIQHYNRSLSSGDTLYLYPDFQFTAANRFEFSLHQQTVDAKQAKQTLDKIRVVPNPYVVTAAWEPQNTYRSGRGPRRIEFIHLPERCTIRI